MSPSGQPIEIHGWCVSSCGLAWQREAVDVVGSLTAQQAGNLREIFSPSFKAVSVPVRLPWLMTLLYPHFYILPHEMHGMLGAFETCMGLSIIRHDRWENKASEAA